jgi:hypothetical protein
LGRAIWRVEALQRAIWTLQRPSSMGAEFPIGQMLNDLRMLSPERKVLLDEIGIVWDPHEADWEVMFNALRRFKYEHGHCNAAESVNPQLARWVVMKRAIEKNGELSRALKASLEQLGFDCPSPPGKATTLNCSDTSMFTATAMCFSLMAVWVNG